MRAAVVGTGASRARRIVGPFAIVDGKGERGVRVLRTVGDHVRRAIVPAVTTGTGRLLWHSRDRGKATRTGGLFGAAERHLAEQEAGQGDQGDQTWPTCGHLQALAR